MAPGLATVRPGAHSGPARPPRPVGSLAFRGMTRKAEFDAEQWTTLTAAPALAALAVAAADRGGTLKEGLSLARAYQQARGEEHAELVEALLASPPVADPQGARDAASLADRAEAAVREASDLLREKATDTELREFGDFVARLADTVARAHKEGAVLGFGGKEISAAEQAVVDRLATALGPRPDA